ncbi:MAG: hypothetical protein OXU67_06700 [Chloroflexota bacterium]|nr:hypothetical protein [Chloroflexota bacterium]
MVKINRRKAALAGVGVAGLGGVAILAAPALAHDGPGGNRDGYLDRLAAALGIERSQLDSAIQSARDQARADGIGGRGGKGFGGHRGKRGRGWHGSKSALGGKMAELTEAVNGATATALGYADVDALKEAASGKFLFDLAAEKNVTIEQLEQARRTAAQPILDGLVNDETLTREQADQLLERVVKVHEPSAEDRAKMAVSMAMKEAIATALGYDSVEALGEAMEGKSLAALAIEKGVTPEQLQTAQQEAAQTALDELVSAGTITREQADSYLARLAWSRTGRGRSRGGRRGGRGGRGHHGGRGRGRGGFKKQGGDPAPSATPASGSTA